MRININNMERNTRNNKNKRIQNIDEEERDLELENIVGNLMIAQLLPMSTVWA
jgi:hypothetical protein